MSKPVQEIISTFRKPSQAKIIDIIETVMNDDPISVHCLKIINTNDFHLTKGGLFTPYRQIFATARGFQKP